MATTSPDQATDIPELLSAAQLARECRVSVGAVNNRLLSGEIAPDFFSGRTMLFASDKLPRLRDVLRPRN